MAKPRTKTTRKRPTKRPLKPPQKQALAPRVALNAEYMGEPIVFRVPSLQDFDTYLLMVLSHGASIARRQLCLRCCTMPGPDGMGDIFEMRPGLPASIFPALEREAGLNTEVESDEEAREVTATFDDGSVFRFRAPNQQEYERALEMQSISKRTKKGTVEPLSPSAGMRWLCNKTVLEADEATMNAQHEKYPAACLRISDALHELSTSGFKVLAKKG